MVLAVTESCIYENKIDYLFQVIDLHVLKNLGREASRNRRADRK